MKRTYLEIELVINEELFRLNKISHQAFNEINDIIQKKLVALED